MQFMIDKSIILQIQTKYKILAPVLNERSKGIWAACEANTIKWGGISAAFRKATGISRQTIHNGISEINIGLQKIDDPGNEDCIQKCRESGGVVSHFTKQINN